ncbi:MAG: hypothetical protein LC751_05470 [Actinobacteria bacterium]|nr:hypothetical protein [Actinomycetota bacterium]
MKSVESLVELNRQATPEREVRLVIEEGFPGGFSGEESVELLRVLQEALTNARRYSGARNVEVKLGKEDGEILMEVSDDGRGFDMASVQAGVGLSAMRERIEGVGGTLAVHGQPGKGTRVVVSIPPRSDTPAPQRL